MENLNTQMDDQLKNRVAELNRANDENRDGRLDAADLKAQLNRIEAQLELQDQQNRGIIANQRMRMVLSVVLCVIILAALAFFSWRMNEAYVNVGHTGSGPAGQHDAGSAGNHRTAEKGRC